MNMCQPWKVKPCKIKLTGHPEHVGGNPRDNRLFIEAVLWCYRNGSPCRSVTIDALGNATSFSLIPGDTHAVAGADQFLPDIEANIIIADKAYHTKNALSFLWGR